MRCWQKGSRRSPLPNESPARLLKILWTPYLSQHGIQCEGYCMKRTELGWTGVCGQQALLSRRESAAEDGSQPSRCVIAVLAPFLALGMNISVSADQYTAYSLKIAQQRIEQAGANWREKEPEVASLGGINKVEGFVFDRASDDLILVGQREEGRSPLALDDLVVALRARFRYNEWPLVSIDPTPDTEKTQMQHVRFEGGIENTAFGKAMFDADYRLKELGMGLADAGIGGFQTAWDRDVEEIDGGESSGERLVSSRFWFYPINPHVTVREGVCVVRGLRVGVFTEALVAKIDGKTVDDAKAFKSATHDAFAKDVSERFDELCRAQPSFNRLRGLQELVAVSKALEELEQRPDLGWWLHRYDGEETGTKPQAKVLRRRYDGKRDWLEVSGGVHLTALAMRLNAGDVTALRDAVLNVRPSPGELTWTFVAAEWLIPIGTGQVRPEDIEPLFAQARFLEEQQRFSDAVSLYDRILEFSPDLAAAWSNKGLALGKLGKWEQGLDCFEQALTIEPDHALAWCHKGAALVELGKLEQGLDCFERALTIEPDYAKAWYNKGLVLGKLGKSREELDCYDRALTIKPDLAEAWCDKGVVLGELGQMEQELQCYERALTIKPDHARSWYNKGGTLVKLDRSREGLACFDRALTIEPDLVEAWYNKGVVLVMIGKVEEALACFDRAVTIKPDYVKAWTNKGAALGMLGKWGEGLHCIERALTIAPDEAQVWYTKGVALYKLKRFTEAWRALTKAEALGHCDASRAFYVLSTEGH